MVTNSAILLCKNRLLHSVTKWLWWITVWYVYQIFFQYQVGTKTIPIDQLLIAMLDEPSTLYQVWGKTKSCEFISNFSWKSYSSMNLYIAGIVVYGHVGRKKCGLLVIAGFSFDYERFHLDNKKRVVPMGGMKMGTVHGWMSHFTTHISFVSFETHWMRHRHTVRPSLRHIRTMSDLPMFHSNFVLWHKNSKAENICFCIIFHILAEIFLYIQSSMTSQRLWQHFVPLLSH